MNIKIIIPDKSGSFSLPENIRRKDKLHLMLIVLLLTVLIFNASTVGASDHFKIIVPNDFSDPAPAEIEQYFEDAWTEEFGVFTPPVPNTAIDADGKIEIGSDTTQGCGGEVRYDDTDPNNK